VRIAGLGWLAALAKALAASADGVHRFLTVCTGCNLCRPKATYVHVGFSIEGVI
jgi:hypothetical protein